MLEPDECLGGGFCLSLHVCVSFICYFALMHLMGKAFHLSFSLSLQHN